MWSQFWGQKKSMVGRISGSWVLSRGWKSDCTHCGLSIRRQSTNPVLTKVDGDVTNNIGTTNSGSMATHIKTMSTDRLCECAIKSFQFHNVLWCIVLTYFHLVSHHTVCLTHAAACGNNEISYKTNNLKKLVHKDVPYDSQPNTENCGQPPTNITKRDTWQ